MFKLFDFVKKYRDYILLCILISVSLRIIRTSENEQIGGYRAFVIGSIGWLQEIFSWVPNPTALKSENRSLRELNLYLSTEVMRSRTSQIKNDKYRKMLDFKGKTEFQVLAADVVGKSVIELRSYITVNRGAKDGIEQGMIARTDAGLVGVIVVVNENYSLIEIIKNRNVKISAKDQRNSIGGIVGWSGGDNFELKNIPVSYDIKAGDTLITSEFSNKYPPDIPIGIILKVNKEEGSLFHKIEIKPFVNFESLEQVFIIKMIPNEEKNALVREMEKKLQALKNK